MKPGALTAFQVLGWITVGLNVLGILIIAIVLSGTYAPLWAYLLMVLLPLVIVALLAGLIVGVVKRSQVARILYAVVAGILILFVLFGLFQGRNPGLGILLAILQIGLLLGSIICSFLPGVSQWIAQGGGGYGYVGAVQPGGYGQPTGQWNAPQPQQTGWPAQGGDTSATATRPCPHCAEPIRPEASKCRFCGSAVTPLA